MMKKIIFLIFLISINTLFLVNAHSTPRKIIIVRHADKLEQNVTGQAVSAKGYIRSVKFAFYLLTNYGDPDFIFTGLPKKDKSSIREIQTAAPLINILTQRHPEIEYEILRPYTHEQYKEFSKYLLTDKQFNNAQVVICWRHSQIAELTTALGVKEKIKPWKDDDYDSVYIIDFDVKSGKVTEFTPLHNQYPMQNDITWESLNAL